MTEPCPKCPPGCVYCAETGKCTCPENHSPMSDVNPTKRFEKFCQENEGAIECRIYED